MIPTRHPSRRGVVLIIVLVVVTVLLLVGYQFLNLMLAENSSAVVSGRLAQARHLADSGTHYASFVLAFPQTMSLSDSPDSYRPWSGLLYDNSDAFHFRPINGPNGVRGYFSIVSRRDPTTDEQATTQGFRFGVEDENGKVNLNAVRQMIKKGWINKSTLLQILQQIPNINEDQANAVINWTDEAGSADEASYYSGLGYQAKNGPYDTTDELLLVMGWTPKQLYGNDRNRNGRLDLDEDDGTGQVDLGLQKYFTVYSRELNVDSTGQQRINLLNTDLKALKTQLDAAVGEEWSNFIILARASQDGVKQHLSNQALESLTLLTNLRSCQQIPQGFGYSPDGKVTITNMDQVTSRQDFKTTTLWDFIDGYVPFKPLGSNQGVAFNSPAQSLNGADKDKLRTTLTTLFDKCSVYEDYEIPARINVNTCPADILTALNLNSTLTEKIVEMRPAPGMDPSTGQIYKTPAWLVTEAEVSPTMLKPFDKFLTAYSQVYRFQVVGYYELSGPQVRLEVVVDTNNGRPRILHWRDLSDLGKGYKFTQRGGAFVP